MLHPLLSHSNALGVSDPETHTRWGLGEWSPQAFDNGSPQEHSPTHYGSGPPRPHAACRATALHRPTPSSHTFILSPELFQHPSITYTPPYLSQPAPGLEPLANHSTRLKTVSPTLGPAPPPGPPENQERRIRRARPSAHWACSPGRGGPGCARRVGSPRPAEAAGERGRWAAAVGARSTGTHATRVPVRRAISSHLRSPPPPPLRPPGRPHRRAATVASHRLPALSSRSAAKPAAAAADCCGAPDPRPRDAPPPSPSRPPAPGPRPPVW